MAEIKKRYKDEELEEFKSIILKKRTRAVEELAYLTETMRSQNDDGSYGETGSYQTLEGGSSSLQKESISQLAARQQKFIQNLDAALIRIENKSYGVCSVTGKLIAKERLQAVPHTTKSIEAKKKQYIGKLS
ncbi:MAG: RNA polymerase-binding transcription factor DksA [Bacteroidetes bacterium MED-G17]|nr:MAG: RNA polymerase-binding transcription factor DksA [Bacteroidetes bacterium MED-G17]